MTDTFACEATVQRKLLNSEIVSVANKKDRAKPRNSETPKHLLFFFLILLRNTETANFWSSTAIFPMERKKKIWAPFVTALSIVLFYSVI